MKKIFATVTMLLCVLITLAQGIVFDHQATWNAVLQKAKSENKLIFVDVYATWCVPCKKMDGQVYNQEKVGNAMNDRFVSVKVQVDTGENDDQFIRSWYADAQMITNAYSITSLPTYLFFSSTGQLINRDAGYKSTEEFLNMISAITDSSQQWQTLLQQFHDRELPFEKMPHVVKQARRLNMDSIANLVAGDYILNYIEKLPDSAWFKRRSLQFYIDNNHLIRADMRAFRFLYEHPAVFDSIAGVTAAAQLVNLVINKEMIRPALFTNNRLVDAEPQWKVLQNNIRQKYADTLAEKLVMEAQLKFFSGKQQWKKYGQTLVRRVDKYGPFSDMGITAIDFNLNNHAWDVLEHVKERTVLLKALAWSTEAVRLNPIANWMDTRANLLYKLGRTDEAIIQQHLAVEKARSDKDPGLQEFELTLQKMKNKVTTK